MNDDDERMRAMLLDWSQRVETWARIKSIADRAMGSFVADKVFGLYIPSAGLTLIRTLAKRSRGK